MEDARRYRSRLRVVLRGEPERTQRRDGQLRRGRHAVPRHRLGQHPAQAQSSRQHIPGMP
jgi:hypothetical protein